MLVHMTEINQALTKTFRAIGLLASDIFCRSIVFNIKSANLDLIEVVLTFITDAF